MSREKQIEEMAKILSEDCGSCENCKALGSTDDGIDCTAYYYARQLYNAGYRKQSEGEWIKSDETTEQYGYLYMCSYCGGLSFLGKYCPRCGAKMKGGAE